MADLLTQQLTLRSIKSLAGLLGETSNPFA